MASSANATRIEPIKRIRIWESLLILEIVPWYRVRGFTQRAANAVKLFSISTLTLHAILCQPPPRSLVRATPRAKLAKLPPSRSSREGGNSFEINQRVDSGE